MNQKQNLFIRKYVDLLYRKKFLLICLLLFSLPIGLTVYLTTPKQYQASSLLSYQRQKINPNKLSPDVESRIRDIVSTITQIVTSRTNLEGLIKGLDLYVKEKKRLPMEDVVELMRKDIKIQPSREGDTFLISYVGGDPSKVVKVTNALASRFIEENLKYREERAVETSTYTNEELHQAKTVMDQKEEAMRDYKLKHYNEMPDQRVSNVSRLISLQEQYQKKQEAILELEKTRVLLQDQLNFRKKFLASGELSVGEDGLSVPPAVAAANDDPDSLAKQRARLEQLRLRYTDNHPEVKKVRKRIEKMEQEWQGSAAEGSAAASSAADKQPVSLDKTIAQYETQMKNIGLSIEVIRREMAELSETRVQYEKWVAAAPVREAEWSSLTREYGELKRHYDNLVAQDLQASSMLNLERRQKGSQFKIEDSARYPEKPFKPNFLKIMAMSVLIASSLGAAIVLASAFLDQSFRITGDIENALRLPVVSVVAFIPTAQEKRRNRQFFLAQCLVLVVASALVLGYFLYAWSQGKIVI